MTSYGALGRFLRTLPREATNDEIVEALAREVPTARPIYDARGQLVAIQGPLWDGEPPFTDGGASEGD